MHKVLLIFTLVLCIPVGMFIGNGVIEYIENHTTIEAQQIEKSEPRLQLQDVSNNLNGWSGDILTFCDTANGNLIYVLVGSDKGGMVVAPNNCHKNPR